MYHEFESQESTNQSIRPGSLCPASLGAVCRVAYERIMAGTKAILQHSPMRNTLMLYDRLRRTTQLIIAARVILGKNFPEKPHLCSHLSGKMRNMVPCTLHHLTSFLHSNLADLYSTCLQHVFALSCLCGDYFAIMMRYVTPFFPRVAVGGAWSPMLSLFE